MLAAAILALTLPAQAFNPTLFFNVTISPFDGFVEYDDVRGGVENNRGVRSWKTEYRETNRSIGVPPGRRPQRVGSTSPQNGVSWVDVKVDAPYQAIYFYGSTNAPPGRFSVASVQQGERPPDDKNVPINNTGPFVAGVRYDPMLNRTPPRLLLNPSSQTSYELVLDHIDLEMGIEATA